MGERAFYFPMATPYRPVGYARVSVGEHQAGAERLPLSAFDVQTVAEAWAALQKGRLWPATPPDGVIYWQPSFVGSDEEIAAGRSRGRSAQLAIMLAVADWILGSAGDDFSVWASGELDSEGKLRPVDDLDQKLRLYLEHSDYHGSRSVFIAPAASRATTDLDRLRQGRQIKELRFDPDNPPEISPAGRPTMLWVNRDDVGQVMDWLVGRGSRDGSRQTTWLKILPGVALLAAAAAALAIWQPFSARDDGGVSVPAPLAGAPFVLQVEHDWRVDLGGIAAGIEGARREGDLVVWEEPLTKYLRPTDRGCGDGRYLPRGARLRYSIGPGLFGVAAVGTKSETLAVLRPPSRAGVLSKFGRRPYRENAWYRKRVFDPRFSLLGAGLLTNYLKLRDNGLVDKGPASVDDFLATEMWFQNALDRSVFLVYSASTCCSMKSNVCSRNDLKNIWCPFPTTESTGRAERSFGLEYENPKHAYLAMHVVGDTRNEGRVELDGKVRAVCAGPHRHTSYLLDIYPRDVGLVAERNWSQYYIEVAFAFVADEVRYKDYLQLPVDGMSGNRAPILQLVRPGWIGAPRMVMLSDFTKTLDPWSRHKGIARLEDGRLRLEREGGEAGSVFLAPQRPLGGRLELGATMSLLTDQSLITACLHERRWGRRVCLTLNTKTENGSQRGAHLLCNASKDNIGVPPESELAEYRFDPGVKRQHRLEVERLADGSWVMWVDGVQRGTSAACRLDIVDEITLSGFQDSDPGHGGYFDDVVVAGR